MIIAISFVLAAGFGAGLRFFITHPLVAPSILGLLIANVIGSFMIGICFKLYQSGQMSSQIYLLVVVSLLGAFTSFSSFSLQVVQLFQEKSVFYAFGLLLAHNVLSIGSCVIALKI
jgi:CrcB protein